MGRQVEPRSEDAVLVWDLPIRVFHWTLLVATGAALGTGFFLLPQALDPHLVAGGIVALLLLFRLLWGFLGSGPSRLSALLFSPSRVLDRLRGRDDARYLGHNPLAGLVMALVLLALLGLVFTGLFSLGGEEQRGPLRAWLSWRVGSNAKQLHELLAWSLLVGIGLHLLGLLHEGRKSGEAIARSMITGLRSAATPTTSRPRPAQARPALALVLLALLGLGAAASAQRLADLPPNGWRSLEREPSYARFEAECGACHTLYHPSLLPAASWRAMMGSLEDHFGEDAWLPPAQAAPITALLVANGNASWDTEAAHLLRARASGQPSLAISEQPAWKDKHAEVLDELERGGNERSATNCEACHPDAVSGHFAGELIHPPAEETKP